jgi:hypothetical protein
MIQVQLRHRHQVPHRLPISRLVPDDFSGPISDADAVRFLEQATWGPVPS